MRRVLPILAIFTSLVIYSQENDIDFVNKEMTQLINDKNVVIIDTSYYNYRDSVYYSEVINLEDDKCIVKNYNTGNYSIFIYLDARFLKIINDSTTTRYLNELFEMKRDSNSSEYYTNGKFFSFYPNHKYEEVCLYIIGQRTGRKTRYYQTGTISSLCFYKNDTLNGKWKTFYEDGDIWFKGKYKNNGKKGMWKEFYSNGNIKSKGRYCMDIKPINVNEDNVILLKWKFPEIDFRALGEGYTLDFKSGKWKYFDETGKIVKEEYYEKGKLIKEYVK